MLRIIIEKTEKEDFINSSCDVRRNKRIIKQKLNGKSIDKIADKEGVTPERIRQIIKKTICKLIDDPVAEYKTTKTLITEHKEELSLIL